MTKDAKKVFDQWFKHIECFLHSQFQIGNLMEKISHRNCELYFGTANKRQVAQVEIAITVYFYFSFSFFDFHSTWQFE